jgi:hypothetical protein
MPGGCLGGNARQSVVATFPPQVLANVATPFFTGNTALAGLDHQSVRVFKKAIGHPRDVMSGHHLDADLLGP